MRRRSYLALAASALSTTAAGCTSSRPGEVNDPQSTATSTTETTTSTATTQSASVSFSDLTVQPAALELNTDYLTVNDGGQYLFAQATVESGEVAYGSYALRLGDRTYAPLAERQRRRLWRAYNAGKYSSSTGGLVVFELPESTSDENPDAVLEYPGGERSLAEDLRTRLAASPSFTTSVTVPSEVAADGSLTVELTITNESDTPARFVGALNRSGPSVAMKPVEAIRPLVPANASKTVTVEQTEAVRETPSEDVGDGETDIEFFIRTVTGAAERSVRVVES